MATEVFTCTVKVQLANGDLASATLPSDASTFRVDQNTAAPASVMGTQSIGFAAHEAIDLTGITTNGISYWRNRDATNFVEIGVDVSGTFYPLVRLDPGERWPFRLSQSAAPYAQADTAAVILERCIFDD